MRIAGRAKFYLLLVSISLIVGGFAKLGDGIRHPFPQRLTYDQFMAHGGTPGYYDVSGGYLDLANSVLPGRSADGYLVPFRKMGAPASDRVRVYAYITDSSIVRQIDRLNNASGRPTTMWGMSHDAQVGPVPNPVMPMEVSGMVNEYGVYNQDASSSSSSGYGSSDRDTTPDYSAYLTIRTDQHPNALLGIGSIIAGVVMLLVSLGTYGLHLDFRGLKEGQRPPAPAGYDTPLVGPGSTYGQTPPPYSAFPQQPAPPAYQSYPPQPHAPIPPQQPPPYPAPQQSTAAPPPPPPTPEPAPAPQPESTPSKQDAEIDRLRDLKTFDPFAE